MRDLHELMLVCVIGVLLSFGSYTLGHIKGETVVQSEWDKDRAALMQANGELIAQHAIDVQRIRDEDALNNQKVERTYQDALLKKDADLLAARADVKRLGGLRIQATCPAGSGTASVAQANGTEQRDEAVTTSIELPEGTQDGLWRLVARADAVVEQARMCQNWIKSNGFEEEQ